MSRQVAVSFSVLAWIAVAAFWLLVTRSAHPTWTLAFIVTGSLITAYAGAAYVNHLLLIPRLLAARRFAAYWVALLGTMIALTGLALAVIRISYERAFGPDADPNGVYKHFGIDFFGMAVHLLVAAAVVWIFQRPGTQHHPS